MRTRVSAFKPLSRISKVGAEECAVAALGNVVLVVARTQVVEELRAWRTFQTVHTFGAVQFASEINEGAAMQLLHEDDGQARFARGCYNAARIVHGFGCANKCNAAFFRR
jgi:hypothetical protein